MTAYTVDQIVEAMARAMDPSVWHAADNSPAAQFDASISLRKARSALATALEMLEDSTEAQGELG